MSAYGQAWEARDPAAAAALFTEDATYRSLIYEDPHLGHEGVTEYWRTVTATQSDVRVRMGRPFVDGDRVAVEFWTNMTADGAPVTLAGCLLVDFAADGRCRRLREYWNFTPESVEPPTEYGT
ncbi:MAG: nuclear transport factor 2 family protein [Acidimicrobiia bacterium]